MNLECGAWNMNIERGIRTILYTFKIMCLVNTVQPLFIIDQRLPTHMFV